MVHVNPKRKIIAASRTRRGTYGKDAIPSRRHTFRAYSSKSYAGMVFGVGKFASLLLDVLAEGGKLSISAMALPRRVASGLM